MPRGGVAGNSARWTVRFTSAGRPEGLSRDDVLDNVTLYWLTGTVISSARLYWGYDEQPSGGRLLDARGVQIPGAVRLPRRDLPGAEQLGRTSLPAEHRPEAVTREFLEYLTCPQV